MRILLLLVLIGIGSTFSAEAQLADTEMGPFYGTASYYANKFQGRRTANGEKFHQDSLTAAHNSFPFGSLVKVTNRSNGKWLVVRINDRMSPKARHLIDLTRSGAKSLDFIQQGYTSVSLELIPTLPVVEEMIQLEADSLPLPTN